MPSLTIRWRRVLLAGGAVALLAVLFGAARTALHAHRMVNPPRVPVVGSFEGAREVTLRTSDGLMLRADFIPSKNGAAILLGHGMEQNRRALAFEAKTLAARGYGVLMLDWRGAGESEGGRPTWGADEVRDVRAALDFLGAQPGVDPARLGALGFSMGGSAIIKEAADDPRLRAFVIEGTPGSLAQEIHFEFGHWGVFSRTVARWVFEREGIRVAEVNPVDHVCQLAPRPILFWMGAEDAPHDSLLAMTRSACGPSRTVWMHGAGHGGYAQLDAPGYARELTEFFTAALGG